MLPRGRVRACADAQRRTPGGPRTGGGRGKGRGGARETGRRAGKRRRLCAALAKLLEQWQCLEGIKRLEMERERKGVAGCTFRYKWRAVI
jgi:hypothetical protein